MNFLHGIYLTNNVEWYTRKHIKFIDKNKKICYEI